MGVSRVYPVGRGITALIQWAVVGLYVLIMFIFAGQEASSASHTGQFLSRWLPHLSAAEIREYVFMARKAVHVGAYGLLTLLAYWAARRTKKLKRVALPFSIVFAFIVAAGDEGYQSFLHHRTGTIEDVLIDGIGIGVVAAALFFIGRRDNKRNKEVAENVEDESG